MAGAPDRTQLCELGQRIAAGLRVVQLRAADVAIYRPERPLPATTGFLRLDGPAVVTSARRVGPAMEVRMFNPHSKKIMAVLQLTGPLAKRPAEVQTVDFEGNPRGELPVVKGAVTVTLKPKQIVTLSVAGL